MTGTNGDLIHLYHGTSAEHAERLVRDGWRPGVVPTGSQCGNPNRLYLTTDPDNARWYADQMEFGVVLVVLIERDRLRLDPEDGVGETVADEFEISRRTGMPANFSISEPLSAGRIGVWVPDELEPMPHP